MNNLNFQKIGNLNKQFGMPQMNTTLNGWQVPLTLVRVVQNVVEGDLVTTEQKFSFFGVWQPLKDVRLDAKPEGQRAWEWIWLHAEASSLNLNVADKVIFNGKRYKVMLKKDYSLNGFVEYEMVRDFETNTVRS